jgi:hypothetical protein
VADDEESRTALKTLRARFLAPLGMTAYARLSHRLLTGDEEFRTALKTLRARFLAPLGMTAYARLSHGLLADDEESRTALKTLRARFLAPLGMTAYARLSHRLLRGDAKPPPAGTGSLLLDGFMYLSGGLAGGWHQLRLKLHTAIVTI